MVTNEALKREGGKQENRGCGLIRRRKSQCCQKEVKEDTKRRGEYR